MTQQGHETRTVEDWITRINQRELAALAAIVQRVQSLVGDEDSSAAQLSEVLRLDPSLSSKILRIANSPTYLVSPDPVTTLTRATTLIGFDAIANICTVAVPGAVAVTLPRFVTFASGLSVTVFV